MHTNVGAFVGHLQAKLRTEPHAAYWDEAWKVIESLPIYATGDNYCFQIRRFDEMVDPPDRLFALPAREFEGHWEVISFAQTALEGMSGNDTVEEFSAALRAARIEIVKSKMFCIANHLYWSATNSTSADTRALTKWLKSIGDQRIGYADESYYELLLEPPTTIGRGSAKWLSDWLGFRYDVMDSPVDTARRHLDSTPDPADERCPVDKSIVLSGAAFAWVDYSLIREIGARRSRELTAAAGHALFMAMQALYDEEGAEESPESWGRKGGLERHKHTRALKDWALGEAERMTEPDRQIARILAGRMPAKFSDVSEDPARLIYDAIRTRRIEERARRPQSSVDGKPQP